MSGSTSKPVSQTIGAGADSLVLAIAQDAWQGSAQYIVRLNGEQVGDILTASALAGSGPADTITVLADLAPGDHTLSVEFLNDAWGGTADTDRNLHVEAVSLNGAAIADAKAVLWSEGSADFAVTRAAAAGAAVTTTIGEGADSLVLTLSQDAYEGNAQYVIRVDGQQVGGTLTAGAARAGGQVDSVTVKGDFAAGAHTVTVDFINDRWDGTADTDRNLYVESVSLNGTPVEGASAELYGGGPVDLGFTKAGDAPADGGATAGEGANSLVLQVSQDAWQGDAEFIVTVDGQQVGGTFTASAARGTGSDTITLKGDWDPAAAHTVEVTFTNDAWGGTAETDRNLYVEGVSFDGKALAGATAELFGNWTAGFDFGGGAGGTDGSGTDDGTDDGTDAGGDTGSGSTGGDTGGSGGGGDTGNGGGTGAGGVPGNWQTVWLESFDNGAGMFSNHWGPGTDTSVPGQITVWTSADDQDSGMMTQPEGYGTPAGGWGYGLYSFTLKTEGVIGVYALTWPASNNWPGPELDVLEITPSGEGYFALHWKGDNGNSGTGGSNEYVTFSWGDVDLTAVNTFAMLWEPGRLTGYLNGEERWTTTENVPLAYEDGGENTAPGIGTQTWWNDGAMGGNNSITLYEASYSVVA